MSFFGFESMYVRAMKNRTGHISSGNSETVEDFEDPRSLCLFTYLIRKWYSIAKSVAAALNRKFYRISVGGLAYAAEIKVIYFVVVFKLCY
jgi:hypothetical protein